MTEAMQHTATDKRDARPLCSAYEIDKGGRRYAGHWLREWRREEAEAMNEAFLDPDRDEGTEEWWAQEDGDCWGRRPR